MNRRREIDAVERRLVGPKGAENVRERAALREDPGDFPRLNRRVRPAHRMLWDRLGIC